MSWKHVFNMLKTNDSGYALTMTMKTEYRFFACGNGEVYFCTNGRAYRTGITVDELY